MDPAISNTQLIVKYERPVKRVEYQFLALSLLQCPIRDSQIMFDSQQKCLKTETPPKIYVRVIRTAIKCNKKKETTSKRNCKLYYYLK